MKCGQLANYSQRTFESEERVAVGVGGMHEARSRQCLVPHADRWCMTSASQLCQQHLCLTRGNLIQSPGLDIVF